MRQKKTTEQKQEAVQEPEVKVEETVETPVEEKTEETVETPVEEKTEETETEQIPEKPAKVEEKEASTDADVPEAVDKILRLYPQYGECFVSKEGFVYPKNAPKYQRKGAVLYKNKYYKP